ncbi:DUF6153 family protein [Streptomyces sp. NPDC093085]|uniref:DUF6153 family protein n=1 Tax=Streptomyces sp. NPDC093085 TaxID=3155068 RepID=UPI003426D0E1
MRRHRHGERGPSGVRALLLVLAVVAGVLAMHGLGPVPAMGPHAMGAVAAAPAHVTPADAPVCAPPEDHDGGHLDHADATCAATGTRGGPELWAPPMVPYDGVASAGPVVFQGVPDGLGDRAPPSLSALQLLRI